MNPYAHLLFYICFHSALYLITFVLDKVEWRHLLVGLLGDLANRLLQNSHVVLLLLLTEIGLMD